MIKSRRIGNNQCSRLGPRLHDRCHRAVRVELRLQDAEMTEVRPSLWPTGGSSRRHRTGSGSSKRAATPESLGRPELSTAVEYSNLGNRAWSTVMLSSLVESRMTLADPSV